MKRRLQSWLVRWLEERCWHTSYLIPGLPNCVIARWSAWLDDRWQTGCWKNEPPTFASRRPVAQITTAVSPTSSIRMTGRGEAQ